MPKCVTVVKNQGEGANMIQHVQLSSKVKMDVAKVRLRLKTRWKAPKCAIVGENQGASYQGV